MEVSRAAFDIQFLILLIAYDEEGRPKKGVVIGMFGFQALRLYVLGK